MIYDSLKKDLYHQYQKVLKKEQIRALKYKKFLSEKNDDANEFLSKLPKGFTYRTVDEYKELINKIFSDLKNSYLFSLDKEEKENVIQQMEDILEEIQEIDQLNKSSTEKDRLEFKVQANIILKKATKLFGYVRSKVLENARKTKETLKTKEKASREKISADKNTKKKMRNKRGIEDLIKKIQNTSDIERRNTSNVSDVQNSQKQEKVINLQSLEKFLLDNQKDLIPELFDAALLALHQAQENPTPENIVQAKYAVQKALDES